LTSPFVTPIQALQFADKYARWNPIEGRRETWEEAVTRVMNFFMKQMPFRILDDQEWWALESAMLAMEVLPSMRILQMAGPALERCNVGAYNCAYLPLDSWESFGELLYILMQGTGVGFSVEADYVDELPRIRKQKKGRDRGYHYVADTTEGWCRALVTGMTEWSIGYDIEFDFSLIRAQGAVLRTKGGRASGPEPLKNLLKFVREKMLSKQGSYLDPIDAHDIACYCGSIVQVGGVRRAAEISLSDLDDRLLRDAKSGNFQDRNPQRQMANNSAVYNTQPSSAEFLEEWLALMKSGTGERGIFNRDGVVSQLPKRRKKGFTFGTNPCGEIVLRPRQFCNLSIAVARADDTAADLKRKVRLAAIFGTLQSTLTKFSYLRPEWQSNCEEERLLGVDITGQMDCPLLQPTAKNLLERTALLSTLRSIAIETNREFAQRLGIPQSAAVTCVKPSGNSAQLFNCSSGLHPRYAPFYIRRVRIGAYTPIAKLLKEAGVPFSPEIGQTNENASVLVFEYPIQAPDKAITRHDLTAIEQLDNWLMWKRHYTEHNPSFTCYVKDVEWPEVGAWVWRNWDAIGGVSFLPHDGGTYELAPYEEITEAEYQTRVGHFPAVDFGRLSEFEKEDMTEINREFSCTGDKCEI
jgi:ribonucleoside-triphosphate reductase